MRRPDFSALFESQSVSITQKYTTAAFNDVPISTYYFDAVNVIAADDITSGCGNSTFCPLNQVSRAEMAVFIVRAVEGGDNFT
jgi:hypothetical protein